MPEGEDFSSSIEVLVLPVEAELGRGPLSRTNSIDCDPSQSSMHYIGSLVAYSVRVTVSSLASNFQDQGEVEKATSSSQHLLSATEAVAVVATAAISAASTLD